MAIGGYFIDGYFIGGYWWFFLVAIGILRLLMVLLL
jgi:hypothetical protein